LVSLVSPVKTLLFCHVPGDVDVLPTAYSIVCPVDGAPELCAMVMLVSAIAVAVGSPDSAAPTPLATALAVMVPVTVTGDV
jgi:hypothetical protein